MGPDDEIEMLENRLLREQSSYSAGAKVLYKLLMENLRLNDFKSFKNIIEHDEKRRQPILDVNYRYENYSKDRLLEVACKTGRTNFVNFLLEKGANPNIINEEHNRAPIHFATEKGHESTLQALLKEPWMINPNLVVEHQTALYMAVKKNYLECAKLLLEAGASPNIPNNKGLTAIHLAAMKKQRNMVELILNDNSEKNKSRDPKQSLDLDSYKDYKGQTAREILQKEYPDITLPSPRERADNVEDLSYYLATNDEIHFLSCLVKVSEDELLKDSENLLKWATERNFFEAVVQLLDKTRGIKLDLVEIAEIAIRQGNHAILRELLNVNSKIANDLIITASSEFGIPSKRRSNKTNDQLECLQLLLDQENVDVRRTDIKGNTPLHYVARAGCQEAATLLLEKGSYIGCMNKFNVPPIADIPESTLSKYFDDCITAQNERLNDCVIEFNYHCLMPYESSSLSNGTRYRKESFTYQGNYEMEALSYIANNSNLKHLLKHPLLSSFLHLKWHRIRHIFFFNFILYILFYVSLNIYILNLTYTNLIDETVERKNVGNNTGTAHNEQYRIRFLWILTAVGLLLIAVREIVQLISSPCHYISSFENWLEIMLICSGIVLLYDVSPGFGAIAILLSAWELIILIGQFPQVNMSTSIEMFKKVTRNFMRFLLLYACLIFAFAFAFYTLFNESGNENFPDPGHSIFKTIIMLTGEFDADDIPFVSHPILSHFIFVLFVFLIFIVLFNLLNGLAVSDTANILDKAELIGLISRVKLIAYIESVAIGVPFLRRSCRSNFTRHCKWNPILFCLKDILLFPNYLKEEKFAVKPYDDNKSCILRMDPRIIEQAKNILLHKGYVSESEKKTEIYEKLQERLIAIESTLNNMKQILQNNNLNVACT